MHNKKNYGYSSVYDSLYVWILDCYYGALKLTH